MGCGKWVAANVVTQIEAVYLVLVLAFSLVFAPTFDIVIAFYI